MWTYQAGENEEVEGVEATLLRLRDRSNGEPTMKLATAKTCERCGEARQRRRRKCNGCKRLLCLPCAYTVNVDMFGPLCYECSTPEHERVRT